ncbi:unnamed protein product [Effrenium voratum]|uniref:Transmembrane protein n=1 Tax=Effrenium voratum TaxID=2562239 RepID=A0AA36ICV5_9DINO|nr:unnamed protein product [Effrenium voratum]
MPSSLASVAFSLWRTGVSVFAEQETLAWEACCGNRGDTCLFIDLSVLAPMQIFPRVLSKGSMAGPAAGGFHRLRNPDSFDEVRKSGLFRSSTPCQLLSRFAIVFQDTLEAFLLAGGIRTRFPTMQQVKLASEFLFNASAETDIVDIFIGHSWSAGRWSKFLALCMYFNLDIAVKCACGTWLLVVTVLLGWGGGITILGGSCLALPCLTYLPISCFFLAFLFAHHIMGETPSVWVDRLCIHQTNPDLKAKQVAALPVFVARSRRMLILWDDTYFERLWCNLELATCARFGGAEKVEVLPVWLAPWLLTSILSLLFSVTLFDILERVFPNWGAPWIEGIANYAEVILGEKQLFVAAFRTWMMSCLVQLPTSLPCFLSFRMKLRSHQLLLDQMAAFDVRNAKCTLPADRGPIEQQMRELFKDGDVLEDQEAKATGDVDAGEVRLQRFVDVNYFRDPLQSFNLYVRGTLRDSVIAQIGDELSVPWRTCLIAILPMIFYSSVSVLGCDSGPCETSSELQGFVSVGQYMVTNSVVWVLCIAVASPLTFPITLRMLKFTFSFGDGPLQHVAAFLCCALASICNCLCSSVLGTLFGVVMVEYSVKKLLAFVVMLVVLIMQNVWLFCGHIQRRSRNEISCRCIKRQAVYEAVGGSLQAHDAT